MALVEDGTLLGPRQLDMGNSGLDAVPEQVAGQVADKVALVEAQLANVDEVRDQLETALTGSTIVAIFIDVTDFIPADALGLVPDDFKIALDFLEVSIK